MAFAPATARDWVTFPDPADPTHEIRADLSFLLSAWSCVWGTACPGIAGNPEEGCCSHGAYFTDKADQKRVAKAAKETEVSSSQTLQTAGQLAGLSRELIRLIQATASA